jgi:TatA/E family protein of Tat protein translocase
MFGSLGFTEIAFILVLALLLFGPKRLPEIGRTIGKGLAEFRRASNDLRRTLESEVALDEADQKRRPAPVPPARPSAVPTADAAAAQPAADSAPGEAGEAEPASRPTPGPVERTD